MAMRTYTPRPKPHAAAPAPEQLLDLVRGVGGIEVEATTLMNKRGLALGLRVLPRPGFNRGHAVLQDLRDRLARRAAPAAQERLDSIRQYLSHITHNANRLRAHVGLPVVRPSR